MKTGLEVLISGNALVRKGLKGRVAYLCHGASVTSDLRFGVDCLQKMLGKRLVKLFGPQHGMVSDVQDNMVETSSCHHPWFDLPVCSLYSRVRKPTAEMLEGVDTMVVDLQDVGCRVYTYFSTLEGVLSACASCNVGVVVLDRPNPAGGTLVEGNVLEERWLSFVGAAKVPMRHAMTLGELGTYMIREKELDLEYSVVKMEGWKRSDTWEQTGLPWVNPSPNLATPDGAVAFSGTVLFEGTTVSEGRGTTRALEMVGAPGIEPYAWWEEISSDFAELGVSKVSFCVPLLFQPTFHKHTGKACGGFQIHIIDVGRCLSWRLGQWLLSRFRRKLGSQFAWSDPPYEYEYENLPIDYINASDKLRHWCEMDGTGEGLEKLEQVGRNEFLKLRKESLLYGGIDRGVVGRVAKVSRFGSISRVHCSFAH